jgi:ABC-2 type transport system ATP-binding protein
VLLDEPTASLDPDVSEKIRAFILKERQERSMSMLITSHNMTELEEMCDRVLFLHQGTILEEGTPQELARKRRQTELHLMVCSGIERLDKLISRFNYRSTKKKNFTVIFLPEAAISSFLSEIGKEEISYSEIEIVHPSLEDFFLDITHKRVVP